MRAYDPKTTFVLSELRNYVRLLVTSIVILSFSLIGYFYWRDNLHYELQKLANYYHLATILHCA